MPILDINTAPYCANVSVMADAQNLSLHNVSRAVYDALPGTGEIEQRHGVLLPYWSKTIVTGPIEIALFTFQPPLSSQADADQSPASQKNQFNEAPGVFGVSLG